MDNRASSPTHSSARAAHIGVVKAVCSEQRWLVKPGCRAYAAAMEEQRAVLRLVPDRAEPAGEEPLWREQVGRQLRRLRAERGETLTETADRAGISPQYLSEIERGRKDASSEMLAAVTGALGASLLDITLAVSADLRVARPARPPRWGGPTCLAA